MALCEEFWPLETPSELNITGEDATLAAMRRAGLKKMVSERREQAVRLAGLYPYDLCGDCREAFMELVDHSSIVEQSLDDYNPEINVAIPPASLDRMAYANESRNFSRIVIRTMQRKSVGGAMTEYVVVGLHEDDVRKYEFVIARWGENMPYIDDLEQSNLRYENYQTEARENAERTANSEKMEQTKRREAEQKRQKRKRRTAEALPWVLLTFVGLVFSVLIVLSGYWLLFVAIPLALALVSYVRIDKPIRRRLRGTTY